MMFKKWHITGRNNFLLRGLLILLAVVLMAGMPIFAASAAKPSNLKDLQPGTWYYAEVSGAIELGLFQGMSEDYFGVGEPITRAQFVTALVRLCGEQSPTTTVNRFLDVPKGTWYYPYIGWAYSKGIVDGVSGTEFAPNQPITRQEMCKMLGSTIEWLTGKTLSKSGAIRFTDRNQIASWAKSWVDKCSANGFINGREDNSFDPFGGATRAEAACVLYRYHAPIKPDEPEIPENPDPELYTLSVSGFALDFDVDQDYYLCQATDFDQCKILGYTGFKSIKVEVEQYASHFPYLNTPYVLGEVLDLGHGRAKVTITATLQDGTTRQYLICVTDPESDVNAYAKVYVNSEVNLRKQPSTSSTSLAKLTASDNTNPNKVIYYLGTVGDWAHIQYVTITKNSAGAITKTTSLVGYVKDTASENYIRWNWGETAQPAQYKAAIDKLKKAHPNWTFTYVDVEMTYEQALNKYGSANAAYINPANYLTEDKIFAFLDIKRYDTSLWNDNMVKAIWTNQTHISKDTALSYFKQAGTSLNMNPVYIACRAALESGYGGSTFAKGTVKGYEGYYNFFGIKCYDSNPTVGAAYAKERNWNSVFRSIVEGANWVKDQYLDRGASTPYFFRFAGYQDKAYMTDVKAPQSEASILKRAYTDPNAKAHFIIPVYRNLPSA